MTCHRFRQATCRRRGSNAGESSDPCKPWRLDVPEADACCDLRRELGVPHRNPGLMESRVVPSPSPQPSPPRLNMSHIFLAGHRRLGNRDRKQPRIRESVERKLSSASGPCLALEPKHRPRGLSLPNFHRGLRALPVSSQKDMGKDQPPRRGRNFRRVELDRTFVEVRMVAKTKGRRCCAGLPRDRPKAGSKSGVHEQSGKPLTLSLSSGERVGVRGKGAFVETGANLDRVVRRAR